MPAALGYDSATATLSSLAGFLRTAEPEPLLWEAKGTKLDANEVRRQCGAFANSQDGGLLILGASQDKAADAWVLDGLEFPDSEPLRYVSSCLREGLRPMPRFNVHSLEVGNNRHIALVEVEPLAAGPCIVRGTVYERVPGATFSVRDPQRLAELYRRGELARASAQEACRQALGLALDAFEALPHYSPYSAFGYEVERPDKLFTVLVAMARVAPPQDLMRRLFSVDFGEQLEAAITHIAPSEQFHQPDILSGVRQDRRMARALSDLPYRPDWAASVDWAGGVSVASCAQQAQTSVPRLLEETVGPAVTQACNLLHGFDSKGDGFLKVRVVDGAGGSWSASPLVDQEIPSGQDPDLAAVGRQLERSLGIDTPEP